MQLLKIFISAFGFASKQKILFIEVCNKHGIAKGEEAIFFFNRLLVGLQHNLTGRQSAYQHQQRALRQMEVGYEVIHQTEFVTGVDEYIRPAAASVQLTVSARSLQSAYCRSANRNNTAPSAFALFTASAASCDTV